MTLLNLIKYELKWRLREPLTLCFILTPVLLSALVLFDMLPERLVSFYDFYKYSEALYFSTMQISTYIWLVMIVSVLAKNYREKTIFLSLPANKIEQWSAIVISLLVISAIYFINLATFLYLANLLTAKEIAINPLHMLLTFLSSGGSLIVFLALSANIRKVFLFIILSFLIIIAPSLVKSISGYFIGNFLLLPYFNCNDIPARLIYFFKYYLPIYYVLSFFIGYAGYRKTNIGYEI